MRLPDPCFPSRLLVAACVTIATGLGSHAAGPSGPWEKAEAHVLRNHHQLTTADRFHKAGEAYFSPDGSRIIFQAIETPAEGEAPAEFYAMFVADTVRGQRGEVLGIDRIRRVSPEGSANTCGWFHPADDGRILFGSTLKAPTASSPPGYDRKTGRYKWMFPPEMRIVGADLGGPIDSPGALRPLAGDGSAYTAECSLTADGRNLLYCTLETGGGDLYVKDMKTGRATLLVGNAGYDGGPFFSPDGRRICYRSDRRNDHRLQLFVADLAFDREGVITGIEREYQLTDNGHVNWAPFWHPGGRHIIYATSEIGHTNYEVFMVDADPGDLPGSTGSIKYGTRKRRLTHANRADVLPVFNTDGSSMMWTSQRGRDGRSQLWVADFVADLDPDPAAGGSSHGHGGGGGEHGNGDGRSSSHSGHDE